MVGIAGGQFSFAMSSSIIHELADLRIDSKTVERQAEAPGREVAEDERSVIEPGDAPTLYVGLDGTGIPVRKTETEGRKGKQADGEAKTREVKLVVVWSAQKRDPKTGRPVRDPGSASHSAAIESIASRDTDPETSPFAKRILRELKRRCFDKAERQVIIGDGAAWIWNFASEHLPNAIQIVDIFHAREHLFDAAKAIYGSGTDTAKAWAQQRSDELDLSGGVDHVIAALEQHPAREEAANAVAYFGTIAAACAMLSSRKRTVRVFGRHRGRMQVPCRKRLKQGGMHWTVDGANAIIALRCALVNDRFDDFWERRAARRAG